MWCSCSLRLIQRPPPVVKGVDHFLKPDGPVGVVQHAPDQADIAPELLLLRRLGPVQVHVKLEGRDTKIMDVPGTTPVHDLPFERRAIDQTADLALDVHTHALRALAVGPTVTAVVWGDGHLGDQAANDLLGTGGVSFVAIERAPKIEKKRVQPLNDEVGVQFGRGNGRRPRDFALEALLVADQDLQVVIKHLARIGPWLQPQLLADGVDLIIDDGQLLDSQSAALR